MAAVLYHNLTVEPSGFATDQSMMRTCSVLGLSMIPV
jgi:hypothetical protein